MYNLTCTCQVNSEGLPTLWIKAHESPAKRTQPKLKVRILVNGFDITGKGTKYLCYSHRFLIYAENVSLFNSPQVPLAVPRWPIVCRYFSFFTVFQIFNSGKNFRIME